ncbi:MAG: tetratricopeptide repeat protein [Candidatus Hodarchaeota archaeon]
MVKPKAYIKNSLKVAKKEGAAAAVAALKEGIGENQGNAELLTALGYALKESGDLAGARDAFQDAMDASSDSPSADMFTGMISVLGRQGEWVKALEIANSARDKYPKDPAILLDLAIVEVHNAEQNPDNMPSAAGNAALAAAQAGKNKNLACKAISYEGRIWNFLKKAGIKLEYEGIIKQCVTKAAMIDPTAATAWFKKLITELDWLEEVGNGFS